MKRYKYNNILIAASLTVLIFSSCSKNDNAVPANPTPIQTTGVVSTFAGSGIFGSTNGTGKAAAFNYPNGVAVDATGNVYVADQGNNEIRKITPAGAVTTLSGTLIPGNTNTSTIGVSASFNGPTGVATDALGNIYVADFGNNLIRKIASTGAVSTLAGGGSATGTKSGNTNDVGTKALFNGPAGVAVDAAGNVYVADFTNNLIRKIDAANNVTTLAGSGKAGSTDGAGTAASFNGPRGVAVDIAGNVYVADANNNLIRKIDATGNVTTFAGSGKKGNTGGNGTAAAFSYPSGVAVDAVGNVYVADALDNLVRKITPTGDVSSLAGSGYFSMVQPFNAPVSVAVDASGNVYVANDYGNIIQVIK
jgi:sugar lactone lactonase YvrE